MSNLDVMNEYIAMYEDYYENGEEPQCDNDCEGCPYLVDGDCTIDE